MDVTIDKPLDNPPDRTSDKAQDKPANKTRRVGKAARDIASDSVHTPRGRQRLGPAQKLQGLNCEEGDLAIIVKDDSDLLNLGLVVRVLSYAGDRRWEIYDHQAKRWTGRMASLPSWYVQAVSGRGISFDRGNGDLVLRKYAHIPDVYLKPLHSTRPQGG
jgi:hypothetical protein